MNSQININSIIIDPIYNWKIKQFSQCKLYYIGTETITQQLSSICTNVDDFNLITKRLSNLTGNFAFILESKNYILAVVDKIRSYPIFYTKQNDIYLISNSARRLKADAGLNNVDTYSILEFKMSGYVTGKNTIFKKLFQLQAGECLIWQIQEKKLQQKRYFQYFPDKIRQESERELIKELDVITTQIFQKIISDAGNKPIWIPLSGGLDSRLILCKLKELGCSNLQSFSYGPPGNYEAKIAKYVAKTLKVPWTFVPSKYIASRNFFHSEERKKFCAFADGLCSVPFSQDILAIMTLMKNKQITKDAIIINGQSGDFITGGHIMPFMLNHKVRLKRFLNAILEKHFSLWINLRTDKNNVVIKNKIKQLLSITNESNYLKSTASYYELWEWQERQSKHVINGQRTYDFLGLNWNLPLWDDKYIDYWKNIPYKYKFNQMLYNKYLTQYNYKGLFKHYSPIAHKWPGPMIGIMPLGRMLSFIYGEHGFKIKRKLYHSASGLGHYRNQFAGYTFKEYFKNISNIRNALSLYIKTWCEENKILFKS